MPAKKNRSTDLTPAGERKRKQRGQQNVSASSTGAGMEILPNPEWHKSARLVWDAAQVSGGRDFYEASDLALLFITCEGLDHWLSQGGRRSPELLRVLMQNLSGLLFSEADRRKVNIELVKPEDDHKQAALAAVTALFEDDDDAEVC